MKNLHAHSLFSTLCIALAGALMSSCTTVEGPPGPPGPPGRDGNAEVYSINYIVEDENWYDVGVQGEDDYFLAADLDVPEITQDIVDDGLVLVYYRVDNQSPWIALPYTFISHNPQYVEKLDFIYDLAYVGLQSQATDRNATPYAGTFRVIVASAIPINKRAVNYQNYDEVADWLQLDKVTPMTRLAKVKSEFK